MKLLCPAAEPVLRCVCCYACCVVLSASAAGVVVKAESKGENHQSLPSIGIAAPRAVCLHCLTATAASSAAALAGQHNDGQGQCTNALCISLSSYALCIKNRFVSIRLFSCFTVLQTLMPIWRSGRTRCAPVRPTWHSSSWHSSRPAEAHMAFTDVPQQEC
jgi:hypothetical protein